LYFEVNLIFNDNIVHSKFLKCLFLEFLMMPEAAALVVQIFVDLRAAIHMCGPYITLQKKPHPPHALIYITQFQKNAIAEPLKKIVERYTAELKKAV
jgi:hypothetical protein